MKATWFWICLWPDRMRLELHLGWRFKRHEAKSVSYGFTLLFWGGYGELMWGIKR